MKFYSQDGQDKFILKLFKNKKRGIFLDIGAFDGVTFSNTYTLENEFNWDGICVEPNPLIFTKLKESRKCLCINCCIGSKNGHYKFMAVSGAASMLSGLIDAMDQRHLNRINDTIAIYGGTKQVIDLPVFSATQIIIENQNIRTIDYCNIDVEGGEMEVLMSIDFTKIKIKVFTIENNNDTVVVRSFLKQYGYKFLWKLGADEVYELNSKRYDLIYKWRLLKMKNSIFSLLSKIKTVAKRKWSKLSVTPK